MCLNMNKYKHLPREIVNSAMVGLKIRTNGAWFSSAAQL